LLEKEMDKLRDLEVAIKMEFDYTTALELYGEYQRKEVEVNLKFFTTEQATHVFSGVSNPIKRVLAEMAIARENTFLCSGVHYNLYRTFQPEISDVHIIEICNITELSTFKQVLATAFDLIAENFRECGLLCDIVKSGQQVLNLGYCLLKDDNGVEKIHVLYLEVFPHKEGNKPKYSFCAREVPKKYLTPNQYMLIPTK
jgi:hypothetical protein